MQDTYMTVGELAKRVGITVRAIQYYDQRSLLHPSQIGSSNQPDSQIAQVRSGGSGG